MWPQAWMKRFGGQCMNLEFHIWKILVIWHVHCANSILWYMDSKKNISIMMFWWWSVIWIWQLESSPTTKGSRQWSNHKAASWNGSSACKGLSFAREQRERAEIYSDQEAMWRWDDEIDRLTHCDVNLHDGLAAFWHSAFCSISMVASLRCNLHFLQVAFGCGGYWCYCMSLIYLFVYLLEVVWADAGKAKPRNDFKWFAWSISTVTLCSEVFDETFIVDLMWTSNVFRLQFQHEKH